MALAQITSHPFAGNNDQCSTSCKVMRTWPAKVREMALHLWAQGLPVRRLPIIGRWLGDVICHEVDLAIAITTFQAGPLGKAMVSAQQRDSTSAGVHSLCRGMEVDDSTTLASITAVIHMIWRPSPHSREPFVPAPAKPAAVAATLRVTAQLGRKLNGPDAPGPYAAGSGEPGTSPNSPMGQLEQLPPLRLSAPSLWQRPKVPSHQAATAGRRVS